MRLRLGAHLVHRQECNSHATFPGGLRSGQRKVDTHHVMAWSFGPQRPKNPLPESAAMILIDRLRSRGPPDSGRSIPTLHDALALARRGGRE